MRLQGGFAGLLAALATGRLDPLSATLPEERGLPKLRGADRRRLLRRERARLKRLADRLPF